MAYSYVQYTGNGATTNYAFSFPYLDSSHIKVRVDGVLTNFSFINANTVQISPAPSAGKIIDIRRETPVNEAPVDFVDGSILLEKDLDLVSRYNLYTTQETTDALTDTMSKDESGRWDAQNRVIRNIANPVEDTDAVSKGYLGYEYPKVSTVANNIASVNTTAGSIGGVNTVAGSINNVNTVSNNITNVNKVSAIDTKVSEVAAIDDKVVVVSNNIANVNTVSGSIASVNTVAPSIANVNTAAQNITNVNTVAGSIVNVNKTGQDIASVNTVASIANDVVIVAQNKLDVQLLADEIVKVQTVANDLNETVSEIEVVANNIANVETVANNIASVNSAFSNAQIATTKAGEASASAASALASAQAADADRIAAELARDRAEGAADATTTNTVIPTQTITGNGTDTYTIDRSVAYAGSILVQVAGVVQKPIEAYNVLSGNQLKFASSIPSGVLISVRWLDKESQTGAAIAQEWATKTGGFVTGSSEYSAKKYAQDSAALYNQAVADTTTIKNQAVTDVTALKNATEVFKNQAADSATASANSATASQTSRLASESARDLSLQYRNEAQAAASAASGSNVTPQVFTGNGSQTDFTLTVAASSVHKLVVTVAGVVQDSLVSYTLANTGTTLRFASAPPNGVRIVVRYI